MTEHFDTLKHGAIKPSNFNPRSSVDAERLDELAQSIAAKGIEQNLVVRALAGVSGRYGIVAGERRWRAIGLLIDRETAIAGAPARDYGIPVKIAELSDTEALETALVENLQRDDMPAIDEAEALARLHAAGLDTATLAKRIGKTQRHIQLRIELAEKLSAKCKEHMRAGSLPLAAARVLAKVPKKQQDQAAPLISAGEHGWRTAADVKRSLFDRLAPVGRNIFKLDKYDGAFAEDPDNPEQKYFADWPQFERLQRAAIKRLPNEISPELNPKFKWVETVEDYGTRLPWGWSIAAKGKNETLGAVVAVNQNTLEVAVHKRVVKREAARGGAGGVQDDTAKARREAEKAARGGFSKKHLAAMADLRTMALQRAVMASPRHGKIVAILGLCGCDLMQIRVTARGPGTTVVDGSITDALSAWLKTINEKLGITLKFNGRDGDYCSKRPASPLGIASDYIGETRKPALLLYDGLKNLDDGQLDQLLAALSARLLAAWTGHEVDGVGDAGVIAAMAQDTGAAVWPAHKLDEAYLEGLGKSELQRLARAVFPRGSEFKDLKTAKKLREAVIELGVLSDIEPPELSFGTAAEIRDRLDDMIGYFEDVPAMTRFEPSPKPPRERRSPSTTDRKKKKPATPAAKPPGPDLDELAAARQLTDRQRRILGYILLRPDQAVSVAMLGRALNCSTGAASQDRKVLREAGLLDDDNRPTGAAEAACRAGGRPKRAA